MSRFSNILLIVFVSNITTFLVVYGISRAFTERDKLAKRHEICYALGNNYHYWNDRNQCVLYVKLPDKK